MIASAPTMKPAPARTYASRTPSASIAGPAVASPITNEPEATTSTRAASSVCCRSEARASASAFASLAA